MLITNGQTSLEQVWHPHRPMKNPTLTFNLDWIIQNDDDDDGGDAGGLGSIVGGRLMLKGSPNAQDPMRRRRPAFNRYRCIYLFCTDQDQPPPPPRPLTRTITLQDTKLCSFWDHLNAIYRITDHISLFHSTVLHSAKPGQNLWLLLSCSSLAPLLLLSNGHWGEPTMLFLIFWLPSSSIHPLGSFSTISFQYSKPMMGNAINAFMVCPWWK